MAAVHTEKRFDSPEMPRLADLYLMEVDLTDALWSLDKIEFTDYGVPKYGLDDRNHLIAALVRYRRVFGKGVRSCIKKSNVPADYHELHQHVIDVTSKHVAHSVNNYEMPHVALSVKESPDKIEVTGLRYGHHGVAELSGQQIKEFRELINCLLTEVISDERKSLEEAVLAKAKELPQAEIRSLDYHPLRGLAKTPSVKSSRQKKY